MYKKSHIYQVDIQKERYIQRETYIKNDIYKKKLI